MGSATSGGGRASYARETGGRVDLEGWCKRRGGLVVGVVALLILAARHVRDEPCRWCWRVAPFLVPGLLFALRHQIAAVLGL